MATDNGKMDQTDRDGRDFTNSPDIRQETQGLRQEAENLGRSAVDSSISTAGTKSELRIQQEGLKYEKDIHSLVGFLSTLDKLLEEIKDTKKGISTRGLSKAGKKGMKEAKFKLKQYEKQLKGKKRTLLKQERAEIYDNDIANLKNSWQQVEKIREEIGMAQRGEYTNIASYLYNSPENARKSNEHQASNLEYYQKFQGILKEGAVLNIFNRNVQEANAFLRRIDEGKHTASDYRLYLANRNVLDPYFQKYQITIPSNPIGTVLGNARASETGHKSVDYSNMDWGETFQKGGVVGLIDKVLSNYSNMTSGQKDTWKTLGVLGIVGGAIYGQYKFYTSKIGWGRKLGATVAPIFASQFLTGKGPLTLFSELLTGGLSMDELKNKFGNAVGGLSSSGSETAETTVPALQSLVIFNSGTTVRDVKQMTRTFRTDKKERKNFYQQSYNNIQRENGNSAIEVFRATFSEDFDEKKWKNWLASFGVTGSTDSNESVHDLAGNAYNNRVILEKFLEENHLNPTTDSNKKSELEAYILGKNEKNESIDINELKSHINDRFTKKDTGTPPQSQENESPEKKSPEIYNETQIDKKIYEALKNGLDKIYSHFEPKIKKINKVPFMKDIKKSDITMWFPELTKIIKSEFVTIENNSVTINIDEVKMGNIFDNFITKLRGSTSTVPKYVKNALANKSWSSLKSQLYEYKTKNNKTKYNNMKENFSVIFNNIFIPIDSALRSQNISPRIICNGQNFNNVNDAINSMSIFK